MKTRTKSKRLVAAAFSFALVAAACGGSSDGGDDGGGDDTADTTAEAEEATDDEGGEEEAMEEEAMEEEAMEEEGGEEAPSGEATGEPILIGIQNPEGDPNGSFPEYSAAALAAAEYINTELGGLGGRPIELELCK